MYFELVRGIECRVFGGQSKILDYLKKREASLKSKNHKFPDLEIVINPRALEIPFAPESKFALELKERIFALGIFSRASIKFSCMHNADSPFSEREIKAFQNLLMILPKNIRCQNVGIILPGNQIHDVGIQCLLAVLRDVGNIDEIDISGSKLLPFNSDLVAQIFAQFSAIKFLNLSNCTNFDHNYLRAISDYCSVLKGLSVSRCDLYNRENLAILLKFMRLESLNISQTHLARQDQVEFLRLLRENKTIKSLNMSRCGIDDSVMLGVLEVVMNQDSPLCAINFSENRLSQEVVTSIINALSRDCLEELKLASCQINEQLMSNILTGVAQSKSLRVLDLSEFNFSTPKFKEQLFGAIYAAKNLTSLSLNACQISENDLPRFLTTRLKTLNLGFGDFRFEPASLQILKQNLDLQSLNLNFSLNSNANKVEIYEAIMVCNMVRKNLQVNDFLNVSGFDGAIKIMPGRMEELKSEAAKIAQEITAKKGKPKVGTVVFSADGGALAAGAGSKLEGAAFKH